MRSGFVIFSMLLSDMYRKLGFFLILALFISVYLEITLFNYTHYVTLVTSEHFSLIYNKGKILPFGQENHFESNANYSINGISVEDSLLLLEPQGKGRKLKFTDLNAEIASIYIEPIFIQGDFQRVKIIWTDEESSGNHNKVSIIKGLDFSNYITIAPRGKISDLEIEFIDNNIAIKRVELNKTIPRAIMPIRLVIVFGISLLLLCLKNAELREKISWFCFDYLYDKVNFRQRIGFAMLVCFMLVFNFLATYTIYGFKDDELVGQWLKMYSHHMTDALIKKQLHFDIKVPEVLLEVERRPYNEMQKHGIWISHSMEPETWRGYENFLPGDHSFYKGKIYAYYGMLPVIILFAPYKLLTGNYLPTSMGNFLFGSMATILLILLWKQIAQNYLKKLPYFFFLISGAALYACSFIPIVLRCAVFHTIPQISALAFVILGVMALLQAKEKLSAKLLVVSSLSFALAVACRPSALFWGILIPVVLWDKRKELINSSRYLLAIIIPFAIVGSILAWYNYARFDSPFEFGNSYLIVKVDQAMFNKINIIEKIPEFIKASLFMLFNPPNLDLTFPFVTVKKSNVPIPYTYIIYFTTVSIFCFPIMWFLFYVRKIDILRDFIFAGIFISLLLNIALFPSVSIEWRYNADFSWIMAIGALICAFQLQEKYVAMRKLLLKIIYSCSGITLLLSFFLTISVVVSSLKMYFYLARTFGIIVNVP
jgi:hypothetical protein